MPGPVDPVSDEEILARLRPPPRLALGDRSSCMLLTDGSVRCWGADFRAVLVQDSPSWQRIGHVDPAAGPFVRLSAASNSTCGLEPGGTVKCWGEWRTQYATLVDIVDLDGMNDDGFLFLRRDGSVFPGDGEAQYIRAAPGMASCFLTPDFQAQCGSSKPPSLPTDALRRLSAGAAHACGVTFDGDVECWGSNGDGQGDSPGGAFADVTAGTKHTCGLCLDGTVTCWGANDDGQAWAPDGTFSEIVAGPRHTCAIPTSDPDRVICWGDGKSFETSPPEALTTEPESFKSITVGGSGTFLGEHWYEDDPDAEDPANGWTVQNKAGHVCGLREDGTVRCYGDAGSPPAGEFDAISAGMTGTCGLTETGIECWGLDSPADNPLDGLSVQGEFTQLSTGWDFVCAVDADHKASCFGTGTTGRTAPDDTFVSVTAGGADHRWLRWACGVRTDASVACWTFNGGAMSEPHDFSGTFREVAVGYGTTCLLADDGTVSCFDQKYQAVAAPDGPFVHVYASQGQACAMRANGSVACWAVMGDIDGRMLEGDFPGPYVDFSLGGDFACELSEGGALGCFGNYVK